MKAVRPVARGGNPLFCANSTRVGVSMPWGLLLRRLRASDLLPPMPVFVFDSPRLTTNTYVFGIFSSGAGGLACGYG